MSLISAIIGRPFNRQLQKDTGDDESHLEESSMDTVGLLTTLPGTTAGPWI